MKKMKTKEGTSLGDMPQDCLLVVFQFCENELLWCVLPLVQELFSDLINNNAHFFKRSCQGCFKNIVIKVSWYGESLRISEAQINSNREATTATVGYDMHVLDQPKYTEFYDTKERFKEVALQILNENSFKSIYGKGKGYEEYKEDPVISDVNDIFVRIKKKLRQELSLLNEYSSNMYKTFMIIFYEFRRLKEEVSEMMLKSTKNTNRNLKKVKSPKTGSEDSGWMAFLCHDCRTKCQRCNLWIDKRNTQCSVCRVSVGPGCSFMCPQEWVVNRHICCDECSVMWPDDEGEWIRTCKACTKCVCKRSGVYKC